MKTNTTYRAIGLALYVLLTMAPLTAGAMYALLYSLGLAGRMGRGFTLEHWKAVISDGTLLQTLGYSAYIALVAIGLGFLGALLLVARFGSGLRSGKKSYLFYLPLAIPALALAFFAFQFLSGGGWMARLTYHIGWIEEPNDFPQLINDYWGVGIIFVHWFLALPFFTILLGNLYQSENLRAHSDSAMTLGASTGQVLRKLLWPVLLRKSWPTLVLYYLFVLGSFEVPLLLGRSNPEMVSVLVVRKLTKFNLADKPEGYAIAFAYIMLMVVVVYWVQVKRKRKRI